MVCGELSVVSVCSGCSPQYLSPEFTNLWAMYPTKYPIARKYETFPSLLLVHTVVLCPSSLQTWDLNTGDRCDSICTMTPSKITNNVWGGGAPFRCSYPCIRRPLGFKKLGILLYI
jgi:hypothetical protein